MLNKTMKASKKGTKLNDIRNFRQPRPYTRKRITEMRLFPDISGVHGDSTSSSKDQKKRFISSQSSGRTRDRCRTLDRERASREIAWLSYTSDERKSEEFNHIREHCEYRGRDIFTETDPEIEIAKLPELPNSVPEIIDIQLQPEPKVDKKIANIEKKKIEKLEANFIRKRELHEKPIKEIEKKGLRGKCEGRAGESSSSNNEKSFWFRYESIRKILDFFSHLLGRRGTTNREKDLAANSQGRQRVETRIERSRNDKTNETKNYSMKERARRSKRKGTTVRRNLASVQPEDTLVSTSTKQITRDEKLRATLLEREMRNRKLEEENRRYKKIFEDKLKTRQMSSPLH